MPPWSRFPSRFWADRVSAELFGSFGSAPQPPLCQFCVCFNVRLLNARRNFFTEDVFTEVPTDFKNSASVNQKRQETSFVWLIVEARSVRIWTRAAHTHIRSYEHLPIGRANSETLLPSARTC